MFKGSCSPSRWIAFASVAVMSRFNVSPNSYGLDAPLASIPVDISRVSWRPKLDLPNEAKRSRSVL